MVYIVQLKDIEWLNGYKNKAHVYAAYKRITSYLKAHPDWKWVDGEMISMQMEIKRKLG